MVDHGPGLLAGVALRGCTLPPRRHARTSGCWHRHVLVLLGVLMCGLVSCTRTPLHEPFKLPPPVFNSAVWTPEVGSTWQWQLTTPVDLSVKADIFNIDLFDNDVSVVQTLKARGTRVICYISVGSWEKWRPDAKSFPRAVLGAEYVGWPGERWLDIRRIDLLAPIMLARLDLCKAKGFDGVEPDNIDAYMQKTGFPLTEQDQLRYNVWFANEARKRGLSVGLKNSPRHVKRLLPYFDWALGVCAAEGLSELSSNERMVR
jgi:hypothetical protein